MTHRTTRAVPFTKVFRRELSAEFSAGHLSPDAGLLLLREADRQIGLTDALDRAIADPRDPQRITHRQLEFPVFDPPAMTATPAIWERCDGYGRPGPTTAARTRLRNIPGRRGPESRYERQDGQTLSR